MGASLHAPLGKGSTSLLAPWSTIDRFDVLGADGSPAWGIAIELDEIVLSNLPGRQDTRREELAELEDSAVLRDDGCPEDLITDVMYLDGDVLAL